MVKRLINLLGSLAVGAADWVGEHIARLLGKVSPPRCVVLAYHSVPSSEKAMFVKQMEMLYRNATPVRADIAALPNHGGRFVALTFDDGLEDIVQNAIPELQKRSIPATLFIVTEALGSDRTWEHYGGDDTRQEKVMTLQQLRELPFELITIGSHSMTHPMLPAIDGDRLWHELSGSRAKLKDLLGAKVTLFSFPYGAFDEQSIEASRRAGYDRVFTALPSFAFSKPAEFVTGRIGINPTDWPIEFRLKMAGAYRWLPYAYALKRSLRSMLRGRVGNLAQLKGGEERVA
jgi:peptidoglycan/xylan/chitin deacetylase (PgdA/CDA1 family)